MIDKRYLFLGILIMLNLVSASNYYSFDLEFDRGQIEIRSVEIGFYQDEYFIYNHYNESDAYYLQVVDSENRVLDRVYFPPPNIVIYDLSEGENFTESVFDFVDQARFKLDSEYFDRGYSAIVYDPNGRELDRILISQFAKEGFSSEDFKDISEEDKKIIFEDKKKDSILDIPKEEYNIYILSLIIILIILIIILVYSLKKKK